MGRIGGDGWIELKYPSSAAILSPPRSYETGAAVFGVAFFMPDPAVSNRGKVLLVDHEAHARRSSTVAGTLLKIPQAQTIIVDLIPTLAPCSAK